MIVGHMVVGGGEAGRYLRQVIDRSKAWVDLLAVALDVSAGPAEEEIIRESGAAFTRLDNAWAEHEGRCRQEAWDWMTLIARPQETDHILLFDADEVVFDPATVRAVHRLHPGKKIGFTFYEMWGPRHYRIDGHWKPYDAHVMIPFIPGGTFRDRPIASGREPQYSHTVVPTSGVPVSPMLHFGYAREEDRRAKYDRYMSLDAGRYHSLSHLKSIVTPPSLAEWTRGGLIDV